MQHFDFYRLQDGGVVALELSEAIDDPSTVIAVEWGGIVADGLPDKRVDVHIGRTSVGEQNRTVVFEYSEALKYLFEAQA